MPEASSSYLPTPSRNSPLANQGPSSRFSSPVHLSQASSRPLSRNPSPLPATASIATARPLGSEGGRYPSAASSPPEHISSRPSDDLDDFDEQAWIDDEDPEMPSDLRPALKQSRSASGTQHTRPLLGKGGSNESNGYSTTPGDVARPGSGPRRRSTFKSRDPEAAAKAATRKRYTYAAFFLVVSLIAFAVQTETAVYINNYLGWKKSYAMLYFTHGSWSSLWFIQLAILRLQHWNVPWATFWRRHVQILHQTAQMVQHGTIHAPNLHPGQNPWPHLFRMIATITCALTVAGGSWYVAVSMTTASDLTAIYNCSAFFAYAFSIPLLNERLRWSKVAAVGVAIIGVLVVAYGDTNPAKHGSKSGGGAGGENPSDPDDDDSTGKDQRGLGNLIIGVGSVLYGLYEVMYKKMACPPEDTSPGRSMIFANFVGSCIGLFTLTVLWIPLPILHWTGLELWEWPPPQARWMLALSVFANAIFSGSFLVLISLTSPVLSSVAALLTIFLVAIVDQVLPKPLYSPLSLAAFIGGGLIIAAFLVLSWATYKEMDEERRKKMVDVSDSDVEGGDDSD
ncbi:hypothetical protein FH972_023082 [Carpinus fangiana]|uniref:Uncharacterized protein n=1 Tax=Carpinus fangiana TaxID=176857 RepID=A0A5N6KU50_9ROSI|nr:hypothetical protein FH972_023082 [Carpinus fangiana]